MAAGCIAAVLSGEAVAIHDGGIRGDDIGGELCLESIGGMQCRDRCHGGVVPVGAGLGRVDDGRRERAAEGCEDLAGDGGGEVGEGVHEGAGRLLGERWWRWELVWMMSMDIYTN
jgi:hypothetical protein